MSEIKHTPGPWLYRYGAIWAAGDGREDEWDGGFIRIGLPDRKDNGTGPVERDCNARLMAAAPELLEGLVQAVEKAGFSLSGPSDWRAAENGEPRWVCKARAVIASAEGAL